MESADLIRQRRAAADGKASDDRVAPASRLNDKRSCTSGLYMSLAIGSLVTVALLMLLVGPKNVIETLKASSASILGANNYPWPIPHEFTKEELANYDGTKGGDLLLLSIVGQVYDVSKGADYYGPKGGYRFFTGRDASRSFIDGCFKEECFDADKGLSGLTDKEIASIYEWKTFYDKEDKYVFVGTLKGWSKSGKRTAKNPKE